MGHYSWVVRPLSPHGAGSAFISDVYDVGESSEIVLSLSVLAASGLATRLVLHGQSSEDGSHWREISDLQLTISATGDALGISDERVHGYVRFRCSGEFDSRTEYQISARVTTNRAAAGGPPPVFRRTAS